MLYFSVYLYNFAACEIMDNWQGNTPIRPLRPYTPLRPGYPHQCLFIFSPCNTSFYCFVSRENYRRKTVKTGHLSFKRWLYCDRNSALQFENGEHEHFFRATTKHFSQSYCSIFIYSCLKKTLTSAKGYYHA